MLPPSLARQSLVLPYCADDGTALLYLRDVERENEAPAERDFPASWTKLSSKTSVLGDSLGRVHIQGGAFALVSTVSSGVDAKTRSAEPRSPVLRRRRHRIALSQGCGTGRTRLCRARLPSKLGPNCRSHQVWEDLGLRFTFRVVGSRWLVRSARVLPPSLARQSLLPFCADVGTALLFLRVVERENEALPSETSQQVGRRKLDQVWEDSLGLGFTFRVVGSRWLVRLGCCRQVPRYSRFAPTSAPHCFFSGMWNGENDTPQRDFPAWTKLSSKTRISFGKTR